jgi:MFS family permease
MATNLCATLHPFRLPVFRRIIIAAFVSGLGDALIPIAFAIESHRVEPSGWGFTVVLLSLWIGRFAGMFIVRRSKPSANPVRVMIASDIVRFTAQIGLLVWLLLLSTHGDGTVATISALAVSAGVYGIATAFFQPARFTAIPRIVPPEHLGHANSLLSIISDGLATAGPLAGSVILLSIGFKAILLIDSISFLIGIVLLMGIKVTRTDPTTAAMIHDDQEPTDTAANDIVLPSWVNIGLITWLFAALAIGLLGVAGPTFVIDRNSALVWAVTAACMAIGSLVGSAVSLVLDSVKSTRWVYLQLLCCLGLAAEVLCFLFISIPVVVWISGFLGSALVTVSGIRWDTLGQSVGSEAQIHAFAVRDQIVNTIGIPAGMLVFGLSAVFNSSTVVVTAVAVVIAIMGIVIATVRIPQYAETDSAD